MTFRILSFDGGSTPATYTRVLQELERQRPGFLDRVDLVIGSSAGASIAAYLADKLGGDTDSQQLAAELVAFGDAVLKLASPDDKELTKRLVAGKEAMLDNTELNGFIEDTVGGPKGLGDCNRKLSVLSCRGRAPFDPVMTTNFGPGHASADRLGDVVVRSSSFPLWMAMRDGHVDGGLFMNNPSACGLMDLVSRTRGTDEAVDYDDIVMMSFGVDDGSSSLSNLYLPGDPLPRLRDLPKVLDTGVKMTPQVREALAKHMRFQKTMGKILKELGLDMDGRKSGGRDDSWGWRQWVAYPANVAYLLQVWLNSVGRGAAWQCSELLGERSLRVAPAAVMGSNEAFLALALGLHSDVVSAGASTVELWADPQVSRDMAFQPTIQDTLAFVDRWWMVDGATRPEGEKPTVAPPETAEPSSPPPEAEPRKRVMKRDRILRSVRSVVGMIFGED